MKKHFFFVLFAASWLSAVAQQLPMGLQYDQAARYFEESLPIGNGKLGALVYGGADDNVIHLNDITLWTGKPVDSNLDAGAHEWIPKIREALFREDYAAADSLQLKVQGPNSQFYQPLGTLHLYDLNDGAITDYRRSLSLDSAIVSDSYRRGRRQMTRQYLASNPDRTIAIRLRGDINVRLALTSQVPHTVTLNPSPTLTMTGHATGDAEQSIHFCTLVSVQTDGRVTSADSTLTISGAREATIYVVNETSFNGFDKHPVTEGRDYQALAADDLRRLHGNSYDDIRQRHIADYRQYYDRVKLKLGNHQVYNGTTDQLLKQYSGVNGGKQNGASSGSLGNDGRNDRYLEELYFQYGRYLLISSSRTKGVPANLQGLWTPYLWSPWRGNYTVNINLEENYWPAFVANLAEMAEPLDDFVRALATNGRHTARNYYGIENGWCSSHNSDLWAMTNPVGEKNEKPEWANWNLGGAWLVNTLWERYLYTQDMKYLYSTALPLMQGAADFCMDWLIENPKNKKELITAPSTSPENEYVNDQGYHGMTCYGGTADLAIIRELLDNTCKATTEAINNMSAVVKAQMADSAQTQMLSQAIGALTAYRMKLVFMMLKLHPYTVGKDGDLNEWYYDWQDFDPQHRHQSHLIGLYPGQHYLELKHLPDNAVLAVPNQLSKEDFMKAAEQTLIQKGDKTTGWSTGWRINLWARLGNAAKAYDTYRTLLSFTDAQDDKHEGARHGGGTYANLMDAHPPFQIDGNFGGTAGVCEMLMQSAAATSQPSPITHHPSPITWEITLLPALPQQWSEGSVSGLCARGGYELSFAWREGKVTACTIKAKTGGSVTLLYNGQKQTLELAAGQCTDVVISNN